MTNEQIIAAGQQIYDETEVGANTSERIGGVIKGIGQRLATRDTEVDEALTQLANQNAGIDAKNGYYTNSQAANESALTVTAPGYVLSAGGNIRIKMAHANTASSVTLNINNTGAKALYYNGEPVDSENTWKDNETIVVYYDGEKYLATNSLGGGNGKLYDTTGVNTDGAMTQKAVSDLLMDDAYGIQGTLNKGGGQIPPAQGDILTLWQPKELEVSVNRIYLDKDVVSAILSANDGTITIAVADSNRTTIATYTTQWTLGEYIIDLTSLNIVVPAGGYIGISCIRPDGTNPLYRSASLSALPYTYSKLSSSVGGTGSENTGNYKPYYLIEYTYKVEKRDIIYTPSSIGNVSVKTANASVLTPFWEPLSEDAVLRSISFSLSSALSDVKPIYIYIAHGSGNSNGWTITSEYVAYLQIGESSVDISDLHITVKAGELVIIKPDADIMGIIGKSTREIPNIMFSGGLNIGKQSTASNQSNTPYEFNYKIDYDVIGNQSDALGELEERIESLENGAGTTTTDKSAVSQMSDDAGKLALVKNGSQSFAASHSDIVKVNGGGVLTDELDSLHSNINDIDNNVKDLTRMSIYGSTGTLVSASTALANVNSIWKPINNQVVLDKLYLDEALVSNITDVNTNNKLKVIVADSNRYTLKVYEKTLTQVDSVIDLSDMGIIVPSGGYAGIVNSKPDGTNPLYNMGSLQYLDSQNINLKETVGEQGTTTANAYHPRYILTYRRDVPKVDYITQQGSCGTVKQSTGAPQYRGFSNWDVKSVDVKLTRINFYGTHEDDIYFSIVVASGSGSSTGWTIHSEYRAKLPAGDSYVDLSELHIAVKAGDLVVLERNNTLYGTIGVSSKNTPNVYFQNLYPGSASTASGWNNTPYDFNYRIDYEIQSPIKEYTENLGEQVEVLSAGGGTVSISDMTGVLLTGSSLTYAGYTPPSYSWPERLNDLLDINLYNGGVSGSTLMGNVASVGNDAALGQVVKSKPSSLRPKYILWNNAANGTSSGAANYTRYVVADRVSRQWGAMPLIGGEEPEMQYRDWNAKDPDAFDQGVRGYAAQTGVLAMPICGLFEKLRAVYPYWGFNSGIHGNYRSQSPYMMLADLLGKLPIDKNVKMFRVRPTYKDGNPSVADLSYNNILDRLKYFTAIGSGRGNSVTTGEADNVPNDKIRTKFSVSGGTKTGNVSSETISMLKGDYVGFNKFGLIEFILPYIGVTKFSLSIKCDTMPTHVYVGVNSTSITYVDGNFSDDNMVWESVDFTYSDNYISAELSGAAVEYYDKVRILIECSGQYNMAYPSLTYYGGKAKAETTILSRYHYRKYGTELNPKTSMETGWNLTGNAQVKSFPALIANYPKGYNEVKSHVELCTSTDGCKKTVSIPAGSNKVAVRVVAQTFPKINTTRFSDNSNFIGTYCLVSKDVGISENDIKLTQQDIGNTYNILGENATVDASIVGYYLHLATQEECAEVLASGYVEEEEVVLKEYDYTYSTLIATFGNQTYVGESQQRRVVYNGWVEYYFEVDVLPTDTAIKIELSREDAIDGLPNSGLPMMIYDVSVQMIE